MDPATALREFLQFVLGQLVDEPEQVSILHEGSGPDGKKHLFKVNLAPNDVGKIIGKNGQTIGAIRSLLNAAAARDSASAVFKIIGHEDKA